MTDATSVQTTVWKWLCHGARQLSSAGARCLSTATCRAAHPAKRAFLWTPPSCCALLPPGSARLALYARRTASAIGRATWQAAQKRYIAAQGALHPFGMGTGWPQRSNTVPFVPLKALPFIHASARKLRRQACEHKNTPRTPCQSSKPLAASSRTGWSTRLITSVEQLGFQLNTTVLAKKVAAVIGAE